MQNGVALNGFASAAAAARSAGPAHPKVLEYFRGLWKRDRTKADLLAMNPNATPERVAWLVWRIRNERVKRPHGFMERGVIDGWTIDAEWLERYQAQAAGGAA